MGAVKGIGPDLCINEFTLTLKMGGVVNTDTVKTNYLNQ